MTSFESGPSSSENVSTFPRPGEYTVNDAPEVQEEGGLLVRSFEELEGGKYESHSALLSPNVMRLSVGATVTIEKVFSDRSGKGLASASDVYGIINVKDSRGTVLKGCVNMNYLSKVSTVAALGGLRHELEG